MLFQVMMKKIKIMLNLKNQQKKLKEKIKLNNLNLKLMQHLEVQQQ